MRKKGEKKINRTNEKKKKEEKEQGKNTPEQVLENGESLPLSTPYP